MLLFSDLVFQHHLVCVAFEHAAQCSCRWVPEPDCAVIRCRGKKLLTLRKSHCINPARVAFEGAPCRIPVAGFQSMTVRSADAEARNFLENVTALTQPLWPSSGVPCGTAV